MINLGILTQVPEIQINLDKDLELNRSKIQNWLGMFGTVLKNVLGNC